MKMLLIMLAMLLNFQTATVHETYNDIVCFETKDGNLYECYGWIDNPDTEYLLIIVNDQVVEFMEVEGG